VPAAALGILVGIVAFAGLMIFLAHRHQRTQDAGIRAAADQLGLVYEPKGERAFRDAWSAIPGLPKRGDVHHVMFGEYAGVPVTCFRHKYMVNTGQSHAVVMHWVFSTDTPTWPTVHLRRRWWLARLLGVRSGVSNHGAFDREWSIKTDSKPFAAELATEKVREHLALPTSHISRWGSPRWHFVGGKACMVVRGDIKADNLRAGLDHLVGMWSALTPS